MKSGSVRYVNPKHLHTMEVSLDRLMLGTFDEFDVKALLLGMRDNLHRLSLKVRQIENAPSPVKVGAPLLADIAHSIAHPELKDQGRIRSYVRSTDVEMAQSLKKMPFQKVISLDEVSKSVHLNLPPRIKPFAARDLTALFVTQLIELFPFDVPSEPLVNAMPDIEVCLLSTMHFLQLPELDGAATDADPNTLRHGYLALQTWESAVHIYAGVVNSRYGGELGSGSNGPGSKPFINVFPVFNSSVSPTTNAVLDARTPRVVYALRNAGGQLELTEPQ